MVWLNERNPPQPPASGHRWPSPALPAMHTKGEVRRWVAERWVRSFSNRGEEEEMDESVGGEGRGVSNLGCQAG